MSRIFITHIVPRDKILKYHLSVAACNFSHNLIESKAFDKVYSILPTFVSGDVAEFEGLVYSSWRNNRILRRFAWLPENLRLLFRIPRKASVWYYNCTILNALLIVLLSIFKPQVRQQMIILDYTPSQNLMSRICLWLTNRMDGTIKLADSPLFTVKNSACLPGIVPLEKTDYPYVGDINKEFLISGALNDNISMLPMLLEAFSRMPDMTLHITGKAPDEELVKKYTSCNSNIHYHGMVEYDKFLDILHSAPFLLSTRNPEMPENQCNFPSKIIEALLHNRIIVSTIDYPQLEGILYFKVGSNLDSFIHDLKGIFDLNVVDLKRYANQGDRVAKTFGSDVWLKQISEIESANR